MSNIVNVDLTKIDYDDIKIDAKLQAVKSAIFNGGDLTDVNFSGSNLNTFIDILTYFSTLSSLELHLKINEMFLGTAKLDSSVFSLIKSLGFYPKTYLASKVVLNIKPNTDISKGDVLKIKPTSDSDYEFYHVVQNDISADEEIYLQFVEGKYQNSPYLFYIDNTKRNLSNTATLQNKWSIDYNTLSVFATINNQEVLFTPIDNSFDLTNYNENPNKYYYFLDFTDDNNLKLNFGVGHLSNDFKGEVKVNYIITAGEEANSQLFKNPDVLITQGDFVMVDSVSDSYYKSHGGVGRIDTSVVKEIAPLFYKQRNGITTKQDLYANLKALYPSYNVKIIGGDELPFNKVRLGTIFFMLYKNQNNIVSNLEGVYQYSNLGLEEYNDNLQEIEKRLHMGTVMVFKEMTFSDIYIKAKLKYNNSENVNTITSNIKNSLSSHFMDNDGKNYYLNKSYLQQVIVESEIEGMIDFDITSVNGSLILNDVNEVNINFDDSNCGCSFVKPDSFDELITQYGFYNIPYPFKLSADMFNNIELNINSGTHIINKDSILSGEFLIEEIVQQDNKSIYFIRKLSLGVYEEICSFKADSGGEYFSDINQILYYDYVTDIELTFNNANELLYKYDIIPILKESNIEIDTESIFI